ncbi:hypothetical protein [Paenisporosarcina indica]|uniref:hypothetical protein n=1 Tax=Paenisporosarcina indica TaxID=650093 RepID=UPI00094FECBA|nr:hypothetical protein [Paenisporosarcina indica]
MKKLLFLILIATLVLIGWNLIDSSDYNGFVVGVKESSLIITTPTSDPMKDDPDYEIFLTEDTEIEGKSDISSFRAGDEVRVWIEDKDETKKIARKIIIDVYGNQPSSEGEH